MNSKSDLEMDGKAEHEECGTPPLQAMHNEKLTRRLLFKLDTRYVTSHMRLPNHVTVDLFANRIVTFSVLPILALLFLCSFLDRTNVGNAKILGLEESLHLTDQQYTTGLAVFYATYIARCDDPFLCLRLGNGN